MPLPTTLHRWQLDHTRALGDLVRAVDATGLQPAVAATYGWDEVPQAFDHLARDTFGKVVVRVQD
ncbi:zinc-binding dehydrogenase [Xylophilus sp.]|uniref:zinc-binding dehydrogenase n=1 Tax=Xylophilus sp. TaxID=2653893 RepID=UPI0013B9D369|nr:zinc-binding dehydrogenase [Xylophilus sp.]KAF1044346.1 MAG: hypothetical protein GAK38_03583 [Xylophilus sp.]